MDFDTVLAQYHEALDTFARGDARDIKRLYSHGKDIVLASPSGAGPMLRANGFRRSALP